MEKLPVRRSSCITQSREMEMGSRLSAPGSSRQQPLQSHVPGSAFSIGGSLFQKRQPGNWVLRTAMVRRRAHHSVKEN